MRVMKYLSVITLLVSFVSCLNSTSDDNQNRNSDTYYFMFDGPLINNGDSKNEIAHFDTVLTRYFDSIDTSNNYKYDRQRFLDSIRSYLKQHNLLIVDTFYKYSNESSICYTYRHKFTINEYEDASATFELTHNIGSDTTFVKHKTFLDSINVTNNGTFIEDKENKSNLWYGTPHFLKEDTVKVFVIEKIANADSYIFRKVNRSVVPWL